MDMVFRDDECRVRTEHAPANFTTIKHMAHNLIRKAPGKDSLRVRRKVAAWDDDFLAGVITACCPLPPIGLPEPRVGWIVRRLGHGGGCRAGAAEARVRYQRVDPGALVLLRPVRSQTDLRPFEPGRDVSVLLQPGPSGTAGPLGHRSGHLL